MGVEVLTLQPKPVEHVTDLVGSVKSRHRTTVQPQVEGFLTKIAVNSGDRVEVGSLLMEIDSKSPQAAIASLEAVKSARDVDVANARTEVLRAKSLLDVGAGTQQDHDRALNAVKAAEAQVRTLDEQIRQLRTDLTYYKVTAPVAGTIGDVPVRTGDRVTRATMLTTIEDNSGLEAYLNVPVQQAPDLRVGLTVRFLGDAGDVITAQPITFVSPSVDDNTQTVLVKTALPASARFRTDQFVRGRVVWSTAPGLTVPLSAVLRINGQYFVFVAEDGRGGMTLARQRAVTLGAVLGNDYVVLSGLKAGERLIVSGVQKIGDGAPVSIGGPAKAPGGAEGK